MATATTTWRRSSPHSTGTSERAENRPRHGNQKPHRRVTSDIGCATVTTARQSRPARGPPTRARARVSKRGIFMTKRSAVLGSRGRFVTGLATAALLGAGFVQAAPTALSAPDLSCPDAYPVSDLAADQLVHGLTVTRGVTPTDFDGQIIGVLKDGIAPGVDMIMAELHSDQIDKTGIWQGMSGSPVYSEDGRLIGAVSYGLAFGPSEVAGITPAADMQALLDGGATAQAAKQTRHI